MKHAHSRSISIITRYAIVCLFINPAKQIKLLGDLPRTLIKTLKKFTFYNEESHRRLRDYHCCSWRGNLALQVLEEERLRQKQQF